VRPTNEKEEDNKKSGLDMGRLGHFGGGKRRRRWGKMGCRLLSSHFLLSSYSLAALL
jgi:hypothetical protein